MWEAVSEELHGDEGDRTHLKGLTSSAYFGPELLEISSRQTLDRLNYDDSFIETEVGGMF